MARAIGEEVIRGHLAFSSEDDASLNQFIVMAVAEKISAFRAEAFFKERAALGRHEKAKKLLSKVRKVPAAAAAGDER
jgi:hypothetical protein